MRTRCGLGGEAPEHAASENNHPQIRLSCMAVRDAASAPNQDDRSDAVPGPSRPSLAASRVECVSVGPRETSPDYPGGVYSGSVESPAFFGLQRCTQCREGEGMEMIHPGHEYAVQAESYPPPGSSYMDRKRTYQK